MRKKKDEHARQLAWKKRNPWARHIEYARRRCTDVKNKDYSFYGGKGIEVHMTAADARALWQRDGASLMKRPSLDRVDSSEDYTVANCRFIEKSLNERLPHDPALADEITPDWVSENEADEPVFGALRWPHDSEGRPCEIVHA